MVHLRYELLIKEVGYRKGGEFNEVAKLYFGKEN